MYNGDVSGIHGGDNVQWNKKLAEELDAADGKKDGKISQSVWNGYLKSMGSTGNRIKNSISVDNAEKSFNYYATQKDNGKADWNNWETNLNDFKKTIGLSVDRTQNSEPKVEMAKTSKTTPALQTPGDTKSAQSSKETEQKMFNKDPNPPKATSSGENGDDYITDSTGRRTRQISRNLDGTVSSYQDFKYLDDGTEIMTSRKGDGTFECYAESDSKGRITREIYENDDSLGGYTEKLYDGSDFTTLIERDKNGAVNSTTKYEKVFHDGKPDSSIRASVEDAKGNVTDLVDHENYEEVCNESGERIGWQLKEKHEEPSYQVKQLSSVETARIEQQGLSSISGYITQTSGAKPNLYTVKINGEGMMLLRNDDGIQLIRFEKGEKGRKPVPKGETMTFKNADELIQYINNPKCDFGKGNRPELVDFHDYLI